MPKPHRTRPIVRVTAPAGTSPTTRPKSKKRTAPQPGSPGTHRSVNKKQLDPEHKQVHGATTAQQLRSRTSHNDTGIPNVKYLSATSVVDRQAARAIAKLLQAHASRRHGVTLKSLTLAPEILSKKATHAVTCQVLKYLPVLKTLVEKADLIDREPQAGTKQISAVTAYVLVYELLMGPGIKQCGPAEHVVLTKKAALKQVLRSLLEERGVQSVEELLPEQARSPAVSHPRWARVNLIRKSVQEVLNWLKERHEQDPDAPVPSLDTLLPDVLAFPSGTDLHDHPLVLEGTLVLQSKASCLPAHALAPGPGWTVLDCCAAPGNKTTHVAALVAGSGGRVIAFDKDPTRLQRLRDNVQRAGAGACVEAHQGDFLQQDPGDPRFAQVRGIILDPSCSGSGTVFTRMDHLLPATDTRQGDAGGGGDGSDDRRVHQLSLFQRAALRHALKFPALQRLVYSTCSVHAAENEEVVADVLPEAAAAGFELKAAFPAWKRRGLPLVEGSEKLVRTDPYEDGTDGFFLAVFERTQAQAEQKPRKKRKK